MNVLNASWFKLLAKVAVFAAALAAWQFCSATGLLAQDSFPSMTSTVTELVRQLGSAELWTAVGQTLQGWGLGLLIGGGLAILTGTLLGLNRFAYRSVIPVVEFLKTVPVIAILPLVVSVYGATTDMKVFLVAFGVYWPLTIQAIYGIRAVDPVVRDTAHILQLRGFRRIAVVTLPSAAPFLATGVRVAAAVGLILAVIAELIGGAPGLGLSLLTAENAGPTQLPALYAFILMTGLTGVAVTGVFTAVERRLLHWHESQRNPAARAA
ncbi:MULTISPECIES: ABC transporter permease subunit [unclassified Micromonospora]|uniref:ABC transporter permease n=1 Tax=unclassified Micromonospora TaxID=2617518 RepID=UPI0033AEAB1A